MTIKMLSLGFSPALAARPKLGSSRSFSLAEGPSVTGRIPTAKVGEAVPALIGRWRVTAPNVIWYGNLVALTETKTSTSTVEETLASGEKQQVTTTVKTTYVIGYKIDIQIGVCLGPDVHLLKIFSDDVQIWSGDIGPARAQVTLPVNDTFLSGVRITFRGGAYDQAPDPIITTPDTPGYVGTAYVILEGVRADLQMGALSFEVGRYPNPLGLTAANNRAGDDINVASALVEVMSNGWGFGGLALSGVDTGKFASIAATLKGEGNFCSLMVDREERTHSIIEGLQEQAAAIVYQSPSDGLITANLIRQTAIAIETLPRFTLSNVDELRDFNKSGWPHTVEQFRANYLERTNNYEVTPVFAQNPANLTSAGRGKRTATLDYPYVPNAPLALKLLARDLAILSSPIFNFEMVTNRDGATLVPGTIVSVTWPDYQMLNVLAVVMKVRKLPISQNKVVVACRQIIFPDNTAVFAPPGAGYDPGITAEPVSPDTAKFYSAPYWIARARNGVSTSSTTPRVFPLVLPKPRNSIQFSFSAKIANIPGAGGNTDIIGDGVYPTFGDLVAPIGLYDNVATGIIPTVQLENVINETNLIDIANAGVRSGRLFMFLNNEIFSFESCVKTAPGKFTLTNVHRALLDTVPAVHAAGDDCYIINNNYSNVPSTAFSYPLGYVPNWLITSNTSERNGPIADAFATAGWAPATNRTLAPPRPHNTKIGGVRGAAPVALTIAAAVTVTWATRSRASLPVRLQLDAADPSEVSAGKYQVHRVFILDSASVLHDCGVTADTGNANALTFNVPAMATGAGFLYVQAESTLGGVKYVSVQQDRLPVIIS